MSSGAIASERSTSKSVNVAALRVGMRLSQDLYDQNRVLLLSAGTEVTPRFLRALESRNIQTVILKPSGGRRAAESLQTAYTRRLDEILLKDQPGGAAPAAQSPARATPDSVRTLSQHARSNVQAHSNTSRTVQNVCQKLDESGAASVDDVQDAVRHFIDMVSLDVDLLPNIVAMQEPKNEYLFDHCVNVSLLSMTIAAQLGLTTEQLMEIGCGALLQDVGMLSVPDEIRFAPRRLTLAEALEMERHPIHTLERLQRISGLASNIAFIGYQVHERIDGSGYPRRRTGHFIHQYAKVVAVADVYSAMTRPRPYRPALIPYLAAKTLVFEAHYEKLDRDCVRAFLDRMSLFPIGSVVQLSNGQMVRTVRANAGAHTRPIVSVIDDKFEDTGEVIDLKSEPSLEVRRVLPPSEISEIDPEDLGLTDPNAST